MIDHSDDKIIIVTAPSGAGKTSIVHALLKKYPDLLAFSVSATTRPARSSERDGRDYYFLSLDEFKQKIQDNAFIEWEMVYEGKYYGTLRAELERIWKLDRVPVLDIDVKGAIHVQQQFPGNCLSIFIEPPSVEELKRRLLSRGTETEDSLAARVNKASYELSFSHQFDRIVVNHELHKATADAESHILGFLKKTGIN